VAVNSAQDVFRFQRLHWVMETSLLKTLAGKHRSTVTTMAGKYKTTVDTPHGPRKWLQVTVPRGHRRNRWSPAPAPSHCGATASPS